MINTTSKMSLHDSLEEDTARMEVSDVYLTSTCPCISPFCTSIDFQIFYFCDMKLHEQ